LVRPREQGLLSTSWRRHVPILSLVSRPADQYRKERVMTRSMFSDDPILLVNAYLDGELDPANALAIEQRMAADSALAAEYTRIGALQRLLRVNGAPRSCAAGSARSHRGIHRHDPSAPATILARARRIGSGECVQR
jgi:anti-sigma factor RsiW